MGLTSQERHLVSADPCAGDNSDERLLEHFMILDCVPCFCELHRRYDQPLKDYVLRFLNQDATEAQDVVQNTWLRVHSRHETFKPGVKVKPWLFSIAANMAIDTQRKLIRKFAYSLDRGKDRYDDSHYNHVVTADKKAVLPQDAAHKAAMAARVREVLSYLPDGDRDAVELIYLSGLTYTQAANTLGIPIGSLKTRVTRSLRFMRVRLDPPGISVA